MGARELGIPAPPAAAPSAGPQKLTALLLYFQAGLQGDAADDERVVRFEHVRCPPATAVGVVWTVRWSRFDLGCSPPHLQTPSLVCLPFLLFHQLQLLVRFVMVAHWRSRTLSVPNVRFV